MLTPVILPQLGDTMNEGTITEWYKREGERVEKGEPLFEVLTDKANMQVEATASGYLRAIWHRENETVPTGEVIGYLSTSADEPLPGGDGGQVQAAAAAMPGVAAESAPGQETAPVRRERRVVSPRARRLAEQKGIDLERVAASSPSGRVVEADVLRFLAEAEAVRPVAAPPSAPPAAAGPIAAEPQERVIPVAGVRRVIAERMSASARQVARVTLTTEADATRLVGLRDDLNARSADKRYSFNEFFVMFAARALQSFSYMNRTFNEDGIHEHRAAHIGVAVDTERGLLVPVVRNAGDKRLTAIGEELARLVQQARDGSISPNDLGGSTFTITNLGAFEIDAFTPIVNLPETAILGIGRIAYKPAAYQGQLALRHMVTLSLAFDHRVVDGAPAARFLQEIKRLTETPGLLLT
ncbi:MAG: dihydrolipoamide acetyltransferase family protein [Rudaea sp.]